MSKKIKVIIQGHQGAFHDVASQEYFGERNIEIIPANSFNELGQRYKNDPTIDYGIMAIENSIAGTILPNYRILREHQFWIKGEIYLRIKMNLMCLPNQQLTDIKEVHSHPMAIYQCLQFLNQYPDFKLVESEDTALSAKYIVENKQLQTAAIASERAAELYGLQILENGIEDNKANYTRFFVVGRTPEIPTQPNKASIWCRIAHQKGSLLKVLQAIESKGINLSKLQSFPVLGKLSEYFFHMDLEFDDLDQFYALKAEVTNMTVDFHELGIYKKADISAALNEEETDFLK